MQVFLSKLAGVAGYTIQYYCIAHCTFEYLADLVIVSIDGNQANEARQLKQASLILFGSCSGPSMEPTIYSDNILLTEHLSPKLSRLDRGDIVIARCPTNPKQQICKRVKGLPGDRIRVGYTSVEVVPRGHVWLEGDNFHNSSDSRNYGPVPQGLIRSRAICRVWPFNDISVLGD